VHQFLIFGREGKVESGRRTVQDFTVFINNEPAESLNG